MPDSAMILDTLFPKAAKKEEDNYEGWRDAFNSNRDYLFMLKEYLEYSLYNLSAKNFNDAGLSKITDPIYAEIEDTQAGAAAIIKVTADEILVQVEQELEGYATTSSLTDTASAIYATVASTYETKSNVATISETVSAQGAKIALVVSTSGGTSSVNAAGIVTAINSAGSSVKISADHIVLTGYVTATDLETEGSTTINGSNITTGSISASYINTAGLYAQNVYGSSIGIYNTGKTTCYGYLKTTTDSTYSTSLSLYGNQGVRVEAASGYNAFIASGNQDSFITLYNGGGVSMGCSFYKFAASGAVYGSSLPSSSLLTGRLFFLLES